MPVARRHCHDFFVSKILYQRQLLEGGSAATVAHIAVPSTALTVQLALPGEVESVLHAANYLQYAIETFAIAMVLLRA